MSEPSITCPSCKTTVKLTESLAAPLIEAERKRAAEELEVRLKERLDAERARLEFELVNASISDSDTLSPDNVNIGLTAKGNLTMQGGTVIAAETASINLLAGGNITLSSLFSTQTTGTAIVVNAGNQIIDGGDTVFLVVFYQINFYQRDHNQRRKSVIAV